MSSQQQSDGYRAFDCGDTCHPDRYTPFTTRTWFGRKRWGVTDQHMGVRLSRLCKDEESLHHWLVALRSMEVRERWSIEGQARRAGFRP